MFIVKEFELDLLNSETRKSKEKLATLIADDFMEFTQSWSIHTKQDIIDILPQCTEEKFEVREYQEKPLAQDIILVNYIADREVIETNLKRCTLCSSIWQKKNNIRQMIFFQWTPAKIVN